MNIIAIVISAFSVLLSLLVFIRFDAKLKNQEKILNEYRIKEYQNAEEEKLYADLSLKTYWRDKDTLKLTIKNDGPSDAYNVFIENLDKDSFLFRDIESSFPIDCLEAGDSMEFNLLVYSDMPEKDRVKLSWQDGSKKQRVEKVILFIHN